MDDTDEGVNQGVLFIIKKDKEHRTPWPSTFMEETSSFLEENEHVFPPRSFFRVRKKPYKRKRSTLLEVELRQ